MKCLGNSHGVKIYNWRDKMNLFMLSTVPEHGDSLIPSGKMNRNNEEIQKNNVFLHITLPKKE